MNVRNIFGRNDTGEVHVPEIEVQDDELRVRGNGSEPNPEAAEEDARNPNQETRSLRLPKTKWFAEDRVTAPPSPCSQLKK